MWGSSGSANTYPASDRGRRAQARDRIAQADDLDIVRLQVTHDPIEATDRTAQHFVGIEGVVVDDAVQHEDDAAPLIARGDRAIDQSVISVRCSSLVNKDIRGSPRSARMPM